MTLLLAAPVLSSSAPTFIFFVLVPVIVFVLVAGIISSQRSCKNLATLGDRLGFSVTPDLKIPVINHTGSSNLFMSNLWGATPRQRGILGIKNGREVRFGAFYTEYGRSKTEWIDLAVRTHAVGFEFTLQPDGLGGQIAEFFGKHKINIGDEVFDRQWRIFSQQPELLKAFLLPELRIKINDQTGNSGGSWIMLDDWLRFQIRGTFAQVDKLALLESLIGLATSMADAIEAAAKKS